MIRLTEEVDFGGASRSRPGVVREVIEPACEVIEDDVEGRFTWLGRRFVGDMTGLRMCGVVVSRLVHVPLSSKVGKTSTIREGDGATALHNWCRAFGGVWGPASFATLANQDGPADRAGVSDALSSASAVTARPGDRTSLSRSFLGVTEEDRGSEVLPSSFRLEGGARCDEGPPPGPTACLVLRHRGVSGTSESEEEEDSVMSADSCKSVMCLRKGATVDPCR